MDWISIWEVEVWRRGIWLMANTLGWKDIVVEGYPTSPSLGGNSLVINGYCSNEDDWVELWEMFRRAPGNAAVNTVLGGRQTAEDLTADSILTQYCSFEDTRLIPGWYILTSFNAPYANLYSYYPYSLNLFFLGSDSALTRAVDLDGADTVTNDWSLTGGYQIALPVGATNLNPKLATFTRTGIDGAEVVASVYGGDEFVGDILSGFWVKADDGVIHTPVSYITGGSLSMSGHAAVAGNEDRSWINSKWPMLAETDTEFDVHLELPSLATADSFGLRYMIGATNNGVADPDAANDILDLQLYANDTNYHCYVRKKVAGTWSDLLATTHITNAEGTFRVRLHVDHIHIYFHDGAGTIVEATDELTGSPFTLVLPKVLWPSYELYTLEATNRVCLSDYVRLTYPDRLRVTYDLAPANNLLGMCYCYDQMGTATETDWHNVADGDHVFTGDCVVQNGLIRLTIDEGAQLGLKLYYYTGAAWSQPFNALEFILVDSATTVSYPYLQSITSISSEKIVVKVAVEDTAAENHDACVHLTITLRRGSYSIEVTYDSSTPSQSVSAYYVNTVTVLRWGYAGNPATHIIGDDDLTLTATNTTMTYNYLTAFDDAGGGVLGFLASTLKPAASTAALRAASGNMEIIAYDTGDLTTVRSFFGLIPFIDIDHLFMEAESATLVAGAHADDMAGDSGTSVHLDVQNDAVYYDVTAGTHLPAGRYLALFRIGDTTQVANDVQLSVRNDTDGAYRNESGADVHTTVTAAWLYYQLVFDITAADVTGTDSIHLQVLKDTADANDIYVDYILIIPLGNGQNWPHDLALNAVMSSVLDRRIVAK